VKERSTRTKAPRFTWLVQLGRFLRVSRLLFRTIWVIYRERRRVVQARARGNCVVQPDGDLLIDVLVTFRETALELGVLMIKLGQFLSSRVDLLPEKAIALLSSLQDEVPPTHASSWVLTPRVRNGQCKSSSTTCSMRGERGFRCHILWSKS